MIAQSSVLLAFIAVCTFAPAQALHVKGSVELDAWTFDKVVGGDRPVLVKFDKDYAYGEKEDAFKEVSRRLGQSGADIFVGVVGVQEYGDKLNQDLAEKFGLTKDQLPNYKLFLKNSKSPIDYTGEVTADEITRFLKREAKLYVALPGCLEAFDDFASTFMQGSAEVRATIQGEAETAANQLTNQGDKQSGMYYNLVMKKIHEKGDGFAASEIIRLSKIVNGNSVTPEKKELFHKRLNILPSFKAGGQKEL